MARVGRSTAPSRSGRRGPQNDETWERIHRQLGDALASPVGLGVMNAGVQAATSLTADLTLTAVPSEDSRPFRCKGLIVRAADASLGVLTGAIYRATKEDIGSGRFVARLLTSGDVTITAVATNHKIEFDDEFTFDPVKHLHFAGFHRPAGGAWVAGTALAEALAVNSWSKATQATLPSSVFFGSLPSGKTADVELARGTYVPSVMLLTPTGWRLL